MAKPNKEKKKYFVILFLLIAATGIINLLMFSLYYQKNMEITRIGDLTYENIGEKVRVQGDMISIQKIATRSLGILEDNSGSIEIFCNCILEKGKLEVIGTVQDYQGRLQIEAEEITEIIYFKE